MLPIVFSHANSFPASTYRVLFQHLKTRGFEVSAVERYGHDPKYPVTSNWPTLPAPKCSAWASGCSWWAIRWADSSA